MHTIGNTNSNWGFYFHFTESLSIASEKMELTINNAFIVKLGMQTDLISVLPTLSWESDDINFK